MPAILLNVKLYARHYTSMPYEQGLPLLAHRLLKWNLDAFFFELTSAADILLQELNIIYAFDDSLEPDDVRWPKIKTKIPEDIRNYMDNEWLSLWFQKVLDYRNQATHQSYIWTSFSTLGSGNWDIEHELKVDLDYFNKKSGELEHEPAAKCKDYLVKMVQYIHSVWQLIYDISVAKEIDKE